MMIHICDRCQNRQEVKTGEPAEGWVNGMCSGCASVYEGIKAKLQQFEQDALKAFHCRMRQPDAPKLW